MEYKQITVYIQLLFLVLLLISCENEEVEGFKISEPYEDTSSYVVDSDIKNIISIKIDTCTFQVLEYDVFPHISTFRSDFRCPTIAITRKETALVACDNRDGNNDKSDIDILLARKVKDKGKWSISKVFVNNPMDGRSMSPQFLIDELNDRIYLFVSHFRNSHRYGMYNNPDEIDYVYKYSDDDGITWSKEYSMRKYWPHRMFSLFQNEISSSADFIWNESKENWNGNEIVYFASCTKGITAADGTLLLPTEMLVNQNTYSSLLIRKNGTWYFSSPTPNLGDNECTVYIDNEYNIILDCRTTTDCRHKYYYDIENDCFIETAPSLIGSHVAVSTEIINDDSLFYMCFPDSPRGSRENISFYGSKDGQEWKKIFRMRNGGLALYGYSTIARYNQLLLACYETPRGIFVQDLSLCRNAIRNAILEN